MTEQAEEVRRGASVYSRRLLSIYDLLVVRLSNTFAWRCHRRRFVGLYNDHVGARHLDVGPGTGWYLANSRWPAGGTITLMDLNPNSLDRACMRIAERSPRTVVANVLEPLPAEIGPFDSIAANYVFHCVPGKWADKGIAFRRLAEKLTPDGVLFGGTILGRGVRHNAAGRKLMAFYNDKGIFHNDEDDAAGLERALRQCFTDVTVGYGRDRGAVHGSSSFGVQCMTCWRSVATPGLPGPVARPCGAVNPIGRRRATPRRVG